MKITANVKAKLNHGSVEGGKLDPAAHTSPGLRRLKEFMPCRKRHIFQSNTDRRAEGCGWRQVERGGALTCWRIKKMNRRFLSFIVSGGGLFVLRPRPA